ncbi:MAG: AmmeMemoRadiSam system protein A [Armatimonadota bacterium]
MSNNFDDPFVALAKTAVEEYIKCGTVALISESTHPDLLLQAGAFVCLKKDGELRGCIGTIEATQYNLSAEIISNAISAATRDPRFFPIEEDELDSLEYTVDILSAPEKINGLDDLDPARYGVIVESGYKRGLLLPDLEGVDTVQYQLDIAMQKAGICPGEPVEIYRFEVIRHS